MEASERRSRRRRRTRNLGEDRSSSEIPSGTGINNLPREILMKIFLYLSVTDLALSVPQVCRRWSDITKDAYLWHSVKYVFMGGSHSISRAVKILSQTPYLGILEVHGVDWKATSEILHIAADKCKAVHTFDAQWFNLMNPAVLEEFLKSSPNLTTLNISSGTDFYLDRSLKYLGNLKVLRIPYNVGLNGSRLRKITDKCCHLQELDITDTESIYDQEFAYLVDHRKDTLQTLAIGGGLLTDASFVRLQELRNLRNLKIGNCQNMTDKSLSSFSNLSFNTLILRRGVDLTSKAFIEFFSHKKQINLKELDLAFCSQVDDSVLTTIGLNCPRLRSANIFGCEGITYLGDRLLENNCKLLMLEHVL